MGKVLTPARWSHSKVPEDRGSSIAGDCRRNRVDSNVPELAGK